MLEISHETIIRASGGDMGAFKQIYDVFSSFVYNVALNVARNPEDAQEITQNVFMKVYKNLGRFKFKSSFKTWLYRIAINAAIDFSKKAARQRDSFISYDDTIGSVIETSDVEKNIDKEANEKLIRTLLDQLNPDQRACIVLRSVEGFSYEDIAQTLQLNINTVRSRLKRAREKMMEYFKREVIENEV